MQDDIANFENFSSKILDRLKNMYNLKEDLQLAKKLKISSNTLHAWRSRDNVNLRTIVLSLPDIDYNFLIKGKGMNYAQIHNHEEENKILKEENRQLRIENDKLLQVIETLSSTLQRRRTNV